MLSKVQSKKEEGFTIIEVLIVLAIAGLILLIVFLAVPALQRNSRNTQRRNDISTILGGVSEYASNNNGSLPTTANQVDDYANTGYYQGVGPDAGEIALATADESALSEDADNDRVVVVTGAKCGADGATVAGSARQVAVQFLVETAAGSWAAQCQEG